MELGKKSFFQKADILAGQDIYQRYGLMDHGSVWGHGSQRGMKFSGARPLHLQGETVREISKRNTESPSRTKIRC